jgi:hypothetical protein
MVQSYTWSLVVGGAASPGLSRRVPWCYRSPHWCLKVNLAGFRLQVVVEGHMWCCTCRRVGNAMTLTTTEYICSIG